MIDPVSLLAALPPALILTAALALPALEASALVGLVIPGETAVFLAGAAAHTGRLSLAVVIAAAAAGAILGDQIGYLVGRRWGMSILARLPHRIRGHRQVQAALSGMARGGWSVVLLGRWTAVLRALVPGLAGSVGMPRRLFTVCNIAGGLTWAAVVASLGYGTGAAYQQTMGNTGPIVWLGLAAVVGAYAATKAVGKHRRRADHVEETVTT